MEVNKLLWDSDFFNKEIGIVKLDQETNIESYENFELIVSFQKSNFTINIDHFKNTFQETKIIYIKELNISDETPSIEVKDHDFYPKTVNFFKHLAFESGKFSRFKLDENFENIQFENLYIKWIENSLNKKFAEKIFYLEENGSATGFVTVSRKENIGTIGLIATHPDFQRKGLGKKLLHAAENYCIKNNLKFLEIATQKENLQACKFYEKSGYHVGEEIIIKHFWKM